MDETHIAIRVMFDFDAIELIIFHRLDEACLYYREDNTWAPVLAGQSVTNTPKLSGAKMALMQHQNNYTMLEAVLEWAFVVVLQAIPDWVYVEPSKPVKNLYHIQEILDPAYCRWDI